MPADNGVVRTQSPDTSPEAERVWIELLRRTPPWRKLQMIEDTTRTLKAAVLAGLTERHPIDSPAMRRRRLADLWLGRELAAKAYGRLS